MLPLKIEYPKIDNTKSSFNTVLKWIPIIIFIGVLIGLVNASFLYALDWVGKTRENNLFIVWLLPLAGVVIIWLYHKYGETSEKGNNLLIEEYHQPKNKVPLMMTPLIYAATLLTHLFGGSAGREGTAIQMGGSISDQFSNFFKDKSINRQILLICGISAGFGSLFGTPITGIVFGFEVLILTKIPFIAIFPAVLVTYLSYFISHYLGAPHTIFNEIHYGIQNVWEIVWIVFSSIIFGFVAYLFIAMQQTFKDILKSIKLSKYYIIAVGGLLIALFVHFFGSKYIGLGLPTLLLSFDEMMPVYDFLLKILLTTFTLSIGFKGGEVTPLFFVGATLGNALFVLGVPISMEVLVALGFVAVFAGATKTPLACSIMGLELFGLELGSLFFLSCYIAYIFSGKTSIYEAHQVVVPKVSKKSKKGSLKNSK